MFMMVFKNNIITLIIKDDIHQYLNSACQANRDLFCMAKE